MAHRAAGGVATRRRRRGTIWTALADLVIVAGLLIVGATAAAAATSRSFAAPVSSTLQTTEGPLAPAVPATSSNLSSYVIPGGEAPPPVAGGASSVGMNGSLHQLIVVEVNRQGTLEVVPPQFTVTLHRHKDELVGTLGPIEVIDSRGTLAGWQLRAILVNGPDGNVALVPGLPIAVNGQLSQVHKGRRSRVKTADGVLLMSAKPGGGGGTYSITARVVVFHDGRKRSGSLTFDLVAS
ncbi:MAG: hypothetical protein ACYCVN_15265 [Acidimicrobiales bacterium]